MIILQSNSDSLEFFLGGVVATSQLPFYASWVDNTLGVIKNGESTAISASATVVTAVPAPAINTSRTIKFLTIHNSDTAPVTVTIRINTNSYQRILCRYTLAVGDMIQYTEDGFTCTNSIGETKITIGGAGMTNLAVANRTATTLDITSSTGTAATVPQASITEAGLLIATDKVKLNNTSGTNTGDQTITLTGDATGSGTGSFAVSVVNILGNAIPADAAGALTNDGAGNLSWAASGAPALTATYIGFGSGVNLLTGSSDFTWDDTGKVLYANGSANIVTSVTSPLLIGGSGVGSKIDYKSTTGVGTSTSIAHEFWGGNNGSVNIAGLYNDGLISFGTTARATLGLIRVVQGTSSFEFGEQSAGIPGLWMAASSTTPTSSNFAMRVSSSITYINSAGSTGDVQLSYLGTTRYIFGARDLSFTPNIRTSGTGHVFTLTSPASTGLTASTEVNGLVYSLSTNRQWATGALTTQREFLINAPTYRFVGASTITNAATLAITGSPIAGTNATITNSMALWIQGGVFRFDDGLVSGSKTIDTTAGDAATINAICGRFRKDTTGATFTLTNSYITANSIIFLTLASDPGVASSALFVTAAAGSATITFQTLPLANTDVNFFVIN